MFEGLITENRHVEPKPGTTTTPPMVVAKVTTKMGNDSKPTQSHNQIDLRHQEDTDFFTVSSCIERHRLQEEPEPSTPAKNLVAIPQRETVKGKEIEEKTREPAHKQNNSDVIESAKDILARQVAILNGRFKPVASFLTKSQAPGPLTRMAK
jgi:hypothetical protein